MKTSPIISAGVGTPTSTRARPITSVIASAATSPASKPAPSARGQRQLLGALVSCHGRGRVRPGRDYSLEADGRGTPDCPATAAGARGGSIAGGEEQTGLA